MQFEEGEHLIRCCLSEALQIVTDIRQTGTDIGEERRGRGGEEGGRPWVGFTSGGIEWERAGTRGREETRGGQRGGGGGSERAKVVPPDGTASLQSSEERGVLAVSVVGGLA
eukprot:3671697-Rhodomonas_salina.1